MDEDVARLASEQHLSAAAELAASRGDLRTAADLYERACQWNHAARAALDACDYARALTLAATAADDEIATAALRGVCEAGGRELVAVAGELQRQGRHAWSARAYEAAGAYGEAAAAWERGGDALAAASVFDKLRNPNKAARVLESALRREPGRADLMLALGELLLRHGKPDAALRVLQRIADTAPERRRGLELSLPALEQLGLTDALAEATYMLKRLGGPRGEALGTMRAPADPSERARARLYGRYEIVREVASTATARVVECIDTLRDERVAIKVFSAEGARGSGRDALARFTREARVLGQLAHPNVVPLRDVLEQGPALVLAWMPGGTLEARLAEGPLAPARAAEVARSVLRALGEAHRLGVVHRDVKPANVLFDAAGGARLSDFGVAHLGDLSVTTTAGVFGSLAYMSPEQREGRPATAASDLFGVGAILHEMLTGQRPSPDVERRLQPSAFHHRLDARHDALVSRLLARDPEERPPDAFTAAVLLDGLPWPQEAEVALHPSAVVKPASLRPAEARLVTDDGGGFARDRWLDRRVVVVALSDTSLERARGFARTGLAGLQTVLRVDAESGTLWLSAPTGPPLDRPLTPTEALAVAATLAGLHAAGFVHGSVERSVVLGPDGPELLFCESQEAGATTETDLLAVQRLAGAG